MALAALAAAPLAARDESGWQLVWADEFDGEALDPQKWAPEQSCWGGGNDERQCYTARPENIEVRDGTLRLKARRERWRGPAFPPEIAPDPNPRRTQPFTSGKVRTRGLTSWKYGRFEVRARVPAGQGTWAAVWMMPQDDIYGGWPLSGEIDILEAVNLGAACEECGGKQGENRVISALHFGAAPPGNRHVDTRVTLPDASLPSDGFHVWAVEWGEGLMRFFLDGKPYWEVTQEAWFTASPKARGRPGAPFDQRFYIMANLAVGGRLSENHNDGGIAEASFPAQLEIDWIRVYQCPADPDRGLACMDRAQRGAH